MFRSTQEEFVKFERSYYHDELYHQFKYYNDNQESYHSKIEFSYLTFNFIDLIEGAYDNRDAIISALNATSFNKELSIDKYTTLMELYQPNDLDLEEKIICYFDAYGFKEMKHTAFLIHHLRFLRSLDPNIRLKAFDLIRYLFSESPESYHNIRARELCLHILRKCNHSNYSQLSYIMNIIVPVCHSSKMLRLLKYKFLTFPNANNSYQETIRLDALYHLDIVDVHYLIQCVEDKSLSFLSDLKIDLHEIANQVPNERLDLSKIIHNILYKYLTYFSDEYISYSSKVFLVIFNILHYFLNHSLTKDWQYESKRIASNLMKGFDLVRNNEIIGEEFVRLFQLSFEMNALADDTKICETYPSALNLFNTAYFSWDEEKISLSKNILMTLIKHSRNTKELLNALHKFGIINLIFSGAIEKENDEYEGNLYLDSIKIIWIRNRDELMNMLRKIRF